MPERYSKIEEIRESNYLQIPTRAIWADHASGRYRRGCEREKGASDTGRQHGQATRAGDMADQKWASEANGYNR